jgi:glycosyltransferase involved in cell wall biosynthesis
VFDGSPGQLAVRLQEILDLPAGERRRLGELARAAVVARWSWSGIASQLVRVAIQD